MLFFETLKDLINEENLKEGDICETLGYYSAGDNGGCRYKITQATPDIFNIALKNGLTATMIFERHIKAESLGIVVDNKTKVRENSQILSEFFTYIQLKQKEIYIEFGSGVYYINNIDTSKYESRTMGIRLFINGNIPDDTIGGVKTTEINTLGEDFFYYNNPNRNGLLIVANNIGFNSRWIGAVPSGRCFYMEDNSLTGEMNFKFNNVAINGFEWGLYSPGYTCGGSGGKNISFSHCTHGCYIRSTSHLLNIDGISINNCIYGFDFFGGQNAEIKNIHVAIGVYNKEEMENVEELFAIKLRGHAILDGIYSENYGQGVVEDSLKKFTLIVHEPCYISQTATIIKNTPIGMVSSPTAGYFLKANSKYGTIEIQPNNKVYFPNGVIKFENCGIQNINAIKVTSARGEIMGGYSFDDKLIYTPNIKCYKLNTMFVDYVKGYLKKNVCGWYFDKIKTEDKTYIIPNVNRSETLGNFENYRFPLMDFYGASSTSTIGVDIKGEMLFENFTPSADTEFDVGVLFKYINKEGKAIYKFAKIDTLKFSKDKIYNVSIPLDAQKIFKVPNNAKENNSPHAEFAFFNRNDGSIGIDNSNIENIKYDFFLHGYVL